MKTHMQPASWALNMTLNKWPLTRLSKVWLDSSCFLRTPSSAEGLLPSTSWGAQALPALGPPPSPPLVGGMHGVLSNPKQEGLRSPSSHLWELEMSLAM